MSTRREQFDAIIETVERLPTMAAQVKALEIILVLLATKTSGGALLRRALNLMSETPPGETPELLAFNRKVVGVLNAAQDDASLAAAIIEAFP